MPTGFAELDEVTNGLHPGQMIVIAARPGVGQGAGARHASADTDGLDHDGRGRGRRRADRCGRQPDARRGRHRCDARADRAIEVEFSDGTVIVADAAHQWLTETRASRKSAQAAAVQYNRYKNQRTFAAVRTTREIAETLRCATVDRRLNHSVANAKPLQAAGRRTSRCRPTRWARGSATARRRPPRSPSADPEIVMRIEAEGLVARPSRVREVSLPVALARGLAAGRARLRCVRRDVRPAD